MKDDDYGHAKDGSNAMNEQDAINVLSEMHGFFEKYKLRFWLDQGVVLGAVREGHLLPHDNDLDISFRLQDASPILKHLDDLKEKGYQIQVHCNTIYLLKNGIEVNFMGFQKDPYGVCPDKYWLMDYISLSPLAIRAQQFYDMATHRTLQTVNGRVAKMIHQLTYLRTARQFVEPLSHFAWKIACVQTNWKGGFYAGYWAPAKFYDKLRTVEMYGLKWNVPFDIEDYLAFKYGKDWRIPKRKWNVWTDDGGVVHDVSLFKTLKLTTLTSCYGDS